MAEILFKGNPIQTIGSLPKVEGSAADFSLTKTDLTQVGLNDFKQNTLILNIFPSLDTEVCAASVRKFNAKAGELNNTKILCISADLPFAHKRFCTTEGIDDVVALSCFRNPEFGKGYGVTMSTGPLQGLLSRAVVVISPEQKILYTQQVAEVTNEPDYEAVLKALG